jgi:glutaredoxin
MTVKIYGAPGCTQCEQTKVKFHRAKINYEYLQLAEHKEQLEKQFEVLPRSMPYVVSGEKMYNFAQVDKLVAELKG